MASYKRDQSICRYVDTVITKHLPFTLGRDKVIQPELPVDFFQPQMNGVVVEMSLGDTVGGDGGRQSRNLGLRVTPTTASLSWGIWVSYISE